MFWEQSHEAIKIFVIILSLWLLAWIVYTFNIKLPSIKIAIETYDETKQTKNIKEEKIWQWWGFFSKIFWSWWSKQHQTSTITSTTIPVYDQEEKKPKSLIKDMLKWVIKQKIQEKTKIINFPEDKPTFDINILESWSQNININQNFLSEKASRLQNKLAEFNIPVEIQGFNVWPSVIQIKVSPSAWIKLSSIENLKNDIALALKTKSLRIISPIPWTDSVGIEIANPHPSLIKLRDWLEEHSFASAMSKNLTNLAMGKWIDGSFVVKSLEEMPHLLVAWSTWSGKSVGINDFILSLLYQNHPGELRFLMIDPKQVELSMYDW
jgi:S-DNA-T family DNA segregation ATPase FtsK/SpoIIIE